MPMKNCIKYLLIGSGLAVCAFARAEDNDCQITVSQTEINYSRLRREDIVTTQQSWNKMPERELTISASCPDQRQMGFRRWAWPAKRPFSVWSERRYCL